VVLDRLDLVVQGNAAVEVGPTNVDINSDAGELRLGLSQDTHVIRRGVGLYGLTPVIATGLSAVTDATVAICTDCVTGSPCAGGGSGALAIRLGGVWVCK
jgi:hypothetical protein